MNQVIPTKPINAHARKGSYSSVCCPHYTWLKCHWIWLGCMKRRSTNGTFVGLLWSTFCAKTRYSVGSWGSTVHIIMILHCVALSPYLKDATLRDLTCKVKLLEDARAKYKACANPPKTHKNRYAIESGVTVGVGKDKKEPKNKEVQIFPSTQWKEFRCLGWMD